MDYSNIRFKSLLAMEKALPDDDACREYLEEIRWGGVPTCSHCGCVDAGAYRLKTGGIFKGLYKCRSCKKRFSVTRATIFEGSHIGLHQWFIAIYLLVNHKKGISSYQLASDIGVTQNTAWSMLSRIRHALSQDRETPKMFGVVQVDECFVGGKNKNRHWDKKVPFSQGRSYKDKTPVFGALCNGFVYAKAVPNTQGETLKPIVYSLIEQGSTIVSDEWHAYRGLNRHYNHIVVDHSRKQYAVDGFSSNGIENFWSHMKRGIHGIYHHVSRKHLQLYCNEYAFRFNTRSVDSGERLSMTLEMADGRVKYDVRL